MASCAFTARFTITCSICDGSAFTRARESPGAKSVFNFFADQLGSILLTSEISGIQIQHARLQHLHAAESQQLPRQRGRAVRGFAHLRDARCAALSVPNFISSRSLCPFITVSRLLKSCATPPASRPTASIFCAWRN